MKQLEELVDTGPLTYDIINKVLPKYNENSHLAFALQEGKWKYYVKNMWLKRRRPIPGKRGQMRRDQKDIKFPTRKQVWPPVPKEKEWFLVKASRYPVDILKQGKDTHKAAVNFPKPCPTSFSENDISVKTVEAKMPDYEMENMKPKEMTTSYLLNKKVEQTQVDITTPKFPDSLFSITIPYFFDSGHSNKLTFTLRMEQNRVKMNLLDGILHCDEWILNEKRVMPSITKLVKYQAQVSDNRLKHKVPLREDIGIYDHDAEESEED